MIKAVKDIIINILAVRVIVGWESWCAPVIPATWTPGGEDDLRAGYLSVVSVCRLDVRTKLSINMGASSEGRASRLSKEGRTGPGQKCSRQSPRVQQ